MRAKIAKRDGTSLISPPLTSGDPRRIASVALALHFAFLGVLINGIRVLAFVGAGHPFAKEPIASSAATYFVLASVVAAAVPRSRVWNALLKSTWLVHLAGMSSVAGLAALVNAAMWKLSGSTASLAEWLLLRASFALPILGSLYCFVVVACRLSDILATRDRSTQRLRLMGLRSRVEQQRARHVAAVQDEIDRTLAAVAGGSDSRRSSEELVIDLAAFLRAVSRRMKSDHSELRDEIDLLSKWLRLRRFELPATIAVSEQSRNATVDSLAVLSTAIDFFDAPGTRNAASVELEVGPPEPAGIPLRWSAGSVRRTFHVVRTPAVTSAGDARPVSATRRLVRIPPAAVALAVLGIGALVCAMRFAAAAAHAYAIPGHLWRWNAVSWCLWAIFSIVILRASSALARRRGPILRDAVLLTFFIVAAALGINYLTGCVVNLSFWNGESWPDYLRDVLACVALSDMAMHIFFGLGTSSVVYAVMSRRAAVLATIRSERAQRLIRKSKGDILRIQLHSHFLYNSLGLINAWLGEDESTAATLAARLRSYYRTCHAAAKAGVIPFRQEMALTEEYMRIHPEDAAPARLEWDVDADSFDALTPPMILQPLVENAARHIKEVRGARAILIRARSRGPAVHILVRNDVARGFHPGPSGIGLWNVGERLRLAYGEVAAGLKMRAGDGAVAVELFFPRGGSDQLRTRKPHFDPPSGLISAQE